MLLLSWHSTFTQVHANNLEKHTFSIFREKMTEVGNGGLILYRVGGRRAEGVGQSGRRNVGKGSRQIGSLQAGSETGLGMEEREKEEKKWPFLGLTRGQQFLVMACFHSLRSRMRGFHDLLRKNPFSLFSC
jgi:hypothetical protein